MANDGQGMLGFIGLGQMGAPMAQCLLAAGFGLVVHDRIEARMQPLVQHGARAASSPREVADLARMVIASVPDASASRALVLAPGGLCGGQAMRHYVETSTIGIGAAREIAAALAGCGVDFIDAPVSGGPRALAQGSLAVMLSGSAEGLAALAPVAAALWGRQFVVGSAPGLAQACKLANNAISLAILQLAAEATVFGVRAGVDAGTLVEVINASSGRSAVTETKFPVSILTRRFDYGASMATGAKDMALFVEEAQALGLLLDSTPAIARAWQAATAAGDPERDFTQIVRRYELVAGVEVAANGTRTAD